jgi:RimJ/RimL family protein N-acetyltransferase
LTPPEREEFVSRWDLYNDPRLGMLVAYQSSASPFIMKPPVAREHREAVWDAIVARQVVAFDVRVAADGRYVGEAGLSRIDWPHGSADIAVVLFDPDDRGRGYGTETVLLLLAYGFDGLGLHRLHIRYLGVNEAVVQAVERTAALVGGRLVGVERDSDWAFGARRDRVVVECLSSDFPPHPATAHLRAAPGP